MGRIATNIETQIGCLRRRGLILDLDDPKIRDILLDIGYYRLGFYWNPFEDKSKEDHHFIAGAKLSDVVALYYLDVDLRHTLMKYINRIEINFRTKLVYYVSNKYKDSPTWFVDPAVVDPQMINDVAKFYNNSFINNNKPIKAHHKKYINDKYAPAWKSLEYFTFGAIISVYRSLKDCDIKVRISETYGVKNDLKFINFLETILLVRNICAHGDVLFDLRTPKGISVIPQITFNNNNRQSLDSCMKVISYFMQHISIDRKQELDNQIDALFSHHFNNVALKHIITDKINYSF